MRSVNRHWRLGQRSFDRLLEHFDPSRDRAGEKYELLRRRLITFFENHGSREPEKQADETIDRVTRRIDEGIKIQDIDRYFAGVARLLSKEVWYEQRRERSVLVQLPLLRAGDSSLEAENRWACFERCFKALSVEKRQLIAGYCRGEWHSRIVTRRDLARSLGIRPGALRRRVHRVRTALEDCFTRCMERSAGGLNRGVSSRLHPGATTYVEQ